MNDIATAVQLTGQADISLQGNLIEASSVMKVLGSKLTTLNLLTEVIMKVS